MFGSGRYGRRDGEWMRGLSLGFIKISGKRGSDGRVSVFGWQWCRWGVGRGFEKGLEGWGGVMSV